MTRWGLMGIMLAVVCACGDAKESGPPAEGSTEIAGEPLGGALSATFEGADVPFRSGVAFTLDNPNEWGGITAGFVEIWMSSVGIDCSFSYPSAVQLGVYAMLSPTDAAVGTYKGIYGSMFRFDGGYTGRGTFGTVELTEYEDQIVAGNVSWEHKDMTAMNGDFQVKHCGAPMQ
jgi:hypothetical protein